MMDHPKQELNFIVCLVSPFPPPYGGMAIQADKIPAALEDHGCKVLAVPTNPDFPSLLQWT